MIDAPHDNEHPLQHWLADRPKSLVWVVVAAAAAAIVLMLASVHHSGVPMLTPGKTATPFNQASIDGLTRLIQAPSTLTV